jgi:pimeloyl-ACP methyl ester carboxylesterase
MISTARGGTPVQLHRESVRPVAGSTVVLSHGLGDDRSTWDELVPLLAARHAVVSWDLRGHGRSDAPADPDSYSPQAGIDDLLSVIDGAGGPVHLIGHSLGGLLSLTVALRRPELVRSLTLVASGPGFRDAGARAAWNSYVDEAVQAMPVPAVAAGLARQDSSWVIDHLDELAVPLLVVVGERDRRFHGGASVLERRVPGCVCRRVAGAGHHVQRTHAGEVAAAVLAHLAATDEGDDAR